MLFRSGTVDHPVVLPSKAALAVAVAGTAILGPGVGTSLGIKAAGAVDKLKGFLVVNKRLFIPCLAFDLAFVGIAVDK